MSTEFDEMMAFAHAIDPTLRELKAEFYNPIQGEASHKVIGWHARSALLQVGWEDQDGNLHTLDAVPEPGWKNVYLVEDPKNPTRP